MMFRCYWLACAMLGVLSSWLQWHIRAGRTLLGVMHACNGQSPTERVMLCRYYWSACAVLGVAGSQLWTYKLVRGLRKHMRATAAADQNLKKAR